MKEHIKSITREFLYNGHLQSIGGVGIVYAAFTIQNTQFSILFAISIYFLLEAIFIFDRLVGLKKDYLTNRERYFHLKNHYWRYSITLTALIVFILISHKSDVVMLLIFGSILLAGFAYPLYMKKLTKIIPLFKNVYVSVVYVFLSIIFLPITPSSIFFAGFVFFESMLGQMMLDIKDISSDRKEKLKTYAAILGKQVTIKTIFFYSFLSLIFLLSHDRVFQLLVLVSIGINFVSLFYILKSKKKGYLLIASKTLVWLLLISALNSVR